MFQDFPSIKEALRSQGAPFKIIYLGHRYGSSFVVRKDGPIHGVRDLTGKKIAIPSRFSDERLLVFKLLRTYNMPDSTMDLVEMPPSQMASALEVNAIDGFVVGEPIPAQAEMAGIGRILFQAREYWPDYMSCIVVARQDVIDERPKAVQVLVDGLARSGVWLDDDRKHRARAAEFVGRMYYHQPPAVLRWALMPPGRVEYNHLTPRKADFEMVRDLMFDLKLIDKKLPFEDFVDTRFAEAAEHVTAWKTDKDHG
jgi:NitT/TauT family transport system substrate-binding protein